MVLAALHNYAGGRRYYIYSYGCWMNFHDSEKYAGLLETAGFTRAHSSRDADLLLFNTCCVCRNVEIQAESDLRKAGDSNAELVIVCGCLTQQKSAAARISRDFPFVRIIFGTGGMERLHERMYDAVVKCIPVTKFDDTGLQPEGLPIRRTSPVSAHVSIMNGCDCHCAYCVVPFVRGRAIYRGAQEILAEINGLQQRDYREITLLGQNVASYRDNTGVSFTKLLRLAADTGMARIGFYTAHPRDVSRELLEIMARTPALEKHIHLPVESGSNAVLKAMNRGYTREEYLEIVDSFYQLMPDGCISTDAMVGFPGETEADFMETVSLFQGVGFTYAYIFAFSPREKTAAAAMKQLDVTVKQERFLRLAAAHHETAARKLAGFAGKVERVLSEELQPGESRLMTGKTSGGIEVTFCGTPELTGRFVNVLITSSDERGLRGKVVTMESS